MSGCNLAWQSLLEVAHPEQATPGVYGACLYIYKIEIIVDKRKMHDLTINCCIIDLLTACPIRPKPKNPTVEC